MSVLKISKDNFENEVINSTVPVILDFWAEWCGPCRMLGPVIDEIAEENSNIKVGKVNVDEEISLATLFGIESIPTLLFFKNGEAYDKLIGVRSKEDILSHI
ncbi:MAG: thioredoxin [Ruminococcaceae bacterium]|nr:thioredoxin [Oscillospiraceae bacterium]